MCDHTSSSSATQGVLSRTGWLRRLGHRIVATTVSTIFLHQSTKIAKPWLLRFCAAGRTLETLRHGPKRNQSGVFVDTDRVESRCQFQNTNAVAREREREHEPGRGYWTHSLPGGLVMSMYPRIIGSTSRLTGKLNSTQKKAVQYQSFTSPTTAEIRPSRPRQKGAVYGRVIVRGHEQTKRGGNDRG